MTDTNTRSAPTIVLVEDDMLIGIDLKQSLQKEGYEVGGPFNTEGAAREFIEENEVDAAILDVNLGHGNTSLNLARELHASGMPFAFLTGYAAHQAQFGAGFEDVVRISKPVKPQDLVATLDRLIEAA